MFDLFKSVRVFQSRTGVLSAIKPDQLESALNEKLFHPCSAQQLESAGWHPLDGNGNMMMKARSEGHDHYLVALRLEEKLLPPKVIQEHLLEKIENIEAQENRKVGRKERSSIKEEIVIDLLPRAFVASSYIYAWIDTHHDRVVVSVSSNKKAELILNQLREALGSLPVIPLATQDPFSGKATSWLKETEQPDGLKIGNQAVLVCASDSTNTVTVKNQALNGDNIQKLIEEEGKVVKKLHLLASNGSLECQVSDELALSGIKIDPDLVVEIDEALGESGDLEAYKAASLDLMIQIYSRFVDSLIDSLGGINTASDEGGAGEE